MLQAQILDADFYPIIVDTHPAVKSRGRHTAIKGCSSSQSMAVAGSHRKLFLLAAVVALCAVLLTLLAVRVSAWIDRRHEAELLALVNPWNSVEYAGFEPRLTDIGDGKQVDERCAEALRQMLADCTAAGNAPYICSAYRTYEEQELLYQNKVQCLITTGLSEKEAVSLSALEVARPGTSEHELGLALDIVDKNHQALDQSQEKMATQRWLMENSWQYGFILRYPNGTTGITGYIYEPWHYRYVGQTAAEQIWQLGITLEQYLTMFYSEEAVVVFEN